jgi:hypothetical protein
MGREAPPRTAVHRLAHLPGGVVLDVAQSSGLGPLPDQAPLDFRVLAEDRIGIEALGAEMNLVLECF